LRFRAVGRLLRSRRGRLPRSRIPPGAQGGTYDSTAQICSQKESQKFAKDICESMGGRYESEIQYCNDVAG